MQDSVVMNNNSFANFNFDYGPNSKREVVEPQNSEIDEKKKLPEVKTPVEDPIEKKVKEFLSGLPNYDYLFSPTVYYPENLFDI